MLADVGFDFGALQRDVPELEPIHLARKHQHLNLRGGSSPVGSTPLPTWGPGSTLVSLGTGQWNWDLTLLSMGRTQCVGLRGR